MMSQSGEFSFLLAAAELAMAAKSPEESKLIISVTVLSLALSPFWLATARPASARRGTAARDLEAGAQTNLCQ
jgi:Kef-type K+ transport system membrane component KefB